MLMWYESKANESKFSFETERNYFMKYANRLTDEELREVYGLFID